MSMSALQVSLVFHRFTTTLRSWLLQNGPSDLPQPYFTTLISRVVTL